jgi:DNA-binding winged helix-turn-helix (wHTH) protein
MIEFPPYRLDLAAGMLWRHQQPVPLRPKTWAVLRYLAERPGLLVSKSELETAVWGQAVSDDALTRTVAELRRILGDDPRTPRIIQTVHRRGFRFIAPLTEHRAEVVEPPALTSRARADALFVGRESELSTLAATFGTALQGKRQVVFITGELGAGKTSLLRSFLHSVSASSPNMRLAWGTCDRLRGRDPFRPALDALHSLSSHPTMMLASVLREVAPHWLAQMPSLQAPDDTARLSLTRAGTTPHGMLREFATLVESIAADEPLVMVFDDLHWSDVGTVDLLGMIAHRPERARLMLVGIYRTTDATAQHHPIAQSMVQLQEHRLCTHIALEGLPPGDVADYVRQRLAASPVPDDMTALIYRRTEGNPMFMAALVDHLLAAGGAIERDHGWSLTVRNAELLRTVPDGLRVALEGQLDLVMPAERAVLDVASVAGMTFDTREIAAVLGESVEAVEARCDHICRVHHLFRTRACPYPWPDGTTGIRYGFVHALYQAVLYDALPPDRRATFHRRIGERLEAGYAGQTGVVSAELADHFQRSHDRPRAIHHLEQCTERAYQRRAYRDAGACLDAALSLLGELPSTPQSAQQELRLRRRHSVVSQTLGSSVEARHENLTRALALSEQTGNRGERFDTLYGLATLYINRCDFANAADMCRQLVALAEDPAVRASWRAHYSSGVTALWTGDLPTAEASLGRVPADPVTEDDDRQLFGVDPVVGTATHESLRLWLIGETHRASERQQKAIATAERLGHPFTIAHAWMFGALFSALCDRWSETARLASRAMELSVEYEFPRWSSIAAVCRGRALVQDGSVAEGLVEMNKGIEALRRAGFFIGGSLLFSLHAGAYLQVGDWHAGLSAADQGLVHCRDTTEQLFESELWRLKAELLLLKARAEPRGHSESQNEGDACLTRAFLIALRQGAHAIAQRVSSNPVFTTPSGSS